MADLKLAYAASANWTCTLASLASSATAGRESLLVDNSTNKYLDYLAMLKVVLQAGTPGNDKAVYVYAWGVVETSSITYPDVVTGADAAITMNDPTQLKLLGTIYAPTSAGTFAGGPWSVAERFGGVCPVIFGFVVRNYTGIALSATEGNHEKLLAGVYQTVA